MGFLEGKLSMRRTEAGEASGANALHVQRRPLSYGALGHYTVACVTGTMGADIAADSEVLQFRWTHTTRLAVLQSVRINSFFSGSIAFVAGIAQFDATIARSWSAAGSGGTTLTVTGNNAKTRTSMAASSVGEIRVATTAALGAGTKTLDTNRVGSLQFAITASPTVGFLAAGASLIGQSRERAGEFFQRRAAQHPLVLAQNEGVSIRTTLPITGTWAASFALRWAEVTVH